MSISPGGDDGVRTLSVVFTDLVDSTELFTRIGEEESDRLRRRHFAVLERAIAGHGGRSVKGLGDGTLSVFESATDAVTSAVAMQQAVAGEGGRPGSEPTAIRVGISSGDVTLEGGDCFGEAVIEASRLCAAADAGEIVVADVVRVLVRGRGSHHLRPLGPLALKGLPEPVVSWGVDWSGVARSLRVVLADDAVLLREGVARILEDNGMSVVAQAGDADELLEYVASTRPDVVITDVRMPPTHTLEGIEAAERIRRAHPEVAVVVLSQHLETRYARRLLDLDAGAVGYVLKERVGEVEQFVDLVRRVSNGETLLDPDLVARM